VDVSFRFYRAGDEERIARLFEGVFGRSVPAEAWRWKLAERPGGMERAILAEEDGEAVFHVGGIPCPAVVDGRPATVMVAVDAMTRADRRRRGLLTEGYRRLFERWREQGVALVLGLPNEQAGTDTRGWRPLFPLRWRVRFLHPERTLARKARLPWLARGAPVGRLWNAAWDLRFLAPTDLVVEEEAPTASQAAALWARCRPAFRHGLVRDAAWFRWRYVEAPGRTYRFLRARRGEGVEGVLCFRIQEDAGRSVGYLAEVLAPADAGEVEEALVRRMVDVAREAGCELVAALAPEGSRREKLLARAGFLRSWGAFTVSCVPLGEGLRVEALGDPRGWSLEGGCFDVV